MIMIKARVFFSLALAYPPNSNWDQTLNWKMKENLVRAFNSKYATQFNSHKQTILGQFNRNTGKRKGNNKTSF